MNVRMPSSLLAGALAAGLSALPLAPLAFAAGDHVGGHGHATDIGKPGDGAVVDRIVEIVMSDNYYEPERVEVREGETVRFIVRNEGEFLHEFNIGTAAMHVEHQEEMATMMEHGMLTPTGVDEEMMKMDHGPGGMAGHAHDDPNSLLLEPGQTGELVWTFTTDIELEFACNIPGHYQAGMTGEIDVQG